MSTFQVTYSFADPAELKAFVDRNLGLPSAPASAAAAAATGEKRGPGRPPKAAPPAASAAKHTRAEVNAALQEVKDKLGTPAAKELIAGLGFQKMNDITEEKFDEAFTKAKAVLEAEQPGTTAADDDI